MTTYNTNSLTRTTLELINERIQDTELKVSLLERIKDSSTQYDSVHNIILYGFNWTETEDGFVFWDNIYRAFRILNL